MKLLATTTRNSLRNILCATDFSSTAQTSLAFAQSIARHYGSKLFAMHVVSSAENRMLPPESWGAVQQLLDETATRKTEQLEAQLQGVRHQVDVCHGDVWTAASELIDRNHIDLLVIGTHGRSGFDRLLMGSVAEKILRYAPCPVLTVGPGVIRDVAQEVRFSEIVFATDFSPASLRAVPYAVSIAQEYQARLTLVHIVPERGGSLKMEDLDILDNTRNLHSLISAEMELWCQPECVVRLGDPVRNILALAEEKKADLIVIGSASNASDPEIADETRIGADTAHSVASLAICPVLTVRG